ncbi:helix-turn-helix domain-containing protein [Sphingobacterium hotanense]|uniref:helix-turn-helix domain-containing protein n=1 Tax=Sphingobacterium TaxID=28453 RepID=UPI0021A8133F|nr:helix-turn-helix transcriptional regulator [Sphingobacterium hotanense]MCT1523652.1 helix-turn-helix domain-containing protein [Sphingobacterium hotanense]
MNKIAFTARTAKGLSKKELAHELDISEACYDELELELSPMSAEMAEKLESLYLVPAEYFLIGSFYNIQVGIDALEQQKEIINNFGFPENLSVSAKAQVSIAKIGLEALVARQEQILLLRQNRELKLENEALRVLYKNSKNINTQ